MNEAKACRQSHYSEALSSLSRSEDGFTELIETLESRLIPIIRSEAPAPPSISCAKDVLQEFVPAADEIRSFAMRFEGRKARLQRLLDRIEL